jgi:hypothetical protein
MSVPVQTEHRPAVVFFAHRGKPLSHQLLESSNAQFEMALSFRQLIMGRNSRLFSRSPSGNPTASVPDGWSGPAIGNTPEADAGAKTEVKDAVLHRHSSTEREFSATTEWLDKVSRTMLVFWLCALPVAAVTLVGLLVAIGSVGDTSAKIVIKTGDVTIGRVAFVFLLTILGFCAVLLAHELLHLLAHPKAGLSRDSVVGVWPRAFVFYAFYDNEISRNRFLVTIALPFMVLSLGPVLLFWLTGKVFLWLVFVALVNGIGSCFDLLVIAMVLTQVPSNALIRNKGWLTYWKPRPGI